jgi:hypothetical protein
LQAAADAFAWSPAAGPSGRGYGIALSSDAGSLVATIAEVKADRASGRVTVVRMSFDTPTRWKAMEAFCRQRARLEGEDAGCWLAEADLCRD